MACWKIATALPLCSPAAPRHRGRSLQLRTRRSKLEGATRGPPPNQQERLARGRESIAQSFGEIGANRSDDIAAAAAQAAAAGFQTCDGRDAKFARELGADYSIAGWVQKVSNLILDMTITIRSARSGRIIAAKGVDMRGNPDETWPRALDRPARFEPEPRGIF